MFSRLSGPGIVMDNLRSLSLSLVVCSLLAPVLGAETIIMTTGILLGSYYGYVIEKQMHELRTLGGRIMKGKSWDYLVLA
ncbi:MAG: hypothetical protein KAT35_02070 [Candidatus Aenigmarchaeota archaeon]|nr:hypothetical protein [Candidatus Aenigmarchaeota archaeon]